MPRPPLVEAAELEPVQRADHDEEENDGANPDHGRLLGLQPRPRLYRPGPIRATARRPEPQESASKLNADH